MFLYFLSQIEHDSGKKFPYQLWKQNLHNEPAYEKRWNIARISLQNMKAFETLRQRSRLRTASFAADQNSKTVSIKFLRGNLAMCTPAIEKENLILLRLRNFAQFFCHFMISNLHSLCKRMIFQPTETSISELLEKYYENEFMIFRHTTVDGRDDKICDRVITKNMLAETWNGKIF